MGKKRSSISYNSGKLPVYNDLSAIIGGEISISSSLSNRFLINDLTGNGFTLRSSGTNRIEIRNTAPILTIVGVAATDVASSQNQLNIPDTVGNRGGFAIYNASAGPLAGITAENVIGGVHPNSRGRLDIWTQNLGSTQYALRIQNDNIDFHTANTLRWSIDSAGNIIQNSTAGRIIFNQTAGAITQGTTDGSDTNTLSIAGGGAVDITRGAFIRLHGNEHVNTGKVFIRAGDVTDGTIDLFTGTDNKLQITRNFSTTDAVAQILSPNGNISLRLGSGSTVGLGIDDYSSTLRFNGAGVAWGDISYYPTSTGTNHPGHFRTSLNGSSVSPTPAGRIGTGSLYLNNGDIIANANITIRQNTADGSDNRRLELSGGGGVSSTRGGFISLFGNEAANTGQVHIGAGDVTNGDIILLAGGAERARIRQNGTVGIGTSSPGALLHVAGSFIAGNLFNSASQSLSVAMDSAGWIKLCTIPSQGTTKIIYYVSSANSEEWGEIEVRATYYNTNTQIIVKRHTYNHHLQEVRVTSSAGGAPKVIYVKIRTTTAAPDITWRLINSSPTSPITIHNSEEVPGTGTALVLPTTSVQNTFQTNTNFDVAGILDVRNDIRYNTSTFNVYSNTSDEADNSLINLCGGGGATFDRGGYIRLYGNEASAGNEGAVDINAGNTGGNGHIRFYTGSGSVPRWRITHNGHLIPNGAITVNIGETANEVVTTFTKNVGTGSATDFILRSNNTDRWQIGSSTGVFAPITTNTYDIGTSAIEVRRVYTRVLGTGSSNPLEIRTNDIARWTLNTSGDLLGNTTNSGHIRLRNSRSLRWRNGADSADVNVLTCDGSENTTLAGSEIQFTANNIPAVRIWNDGTVSLKSHTSYGDSGKREKTYATNTTNNTTTNLFIMGINDNTTYFFEVDIVGRLNSTTSKGVGGKLKFVVYRNNGGNAIIADDFGGRIKEIETYGSSGYDFDVDTSGTDLRIRITGGSGETVSWVAFSKYTRVSTAS